MVCMNQHTYCSECLKDLWKKGYKKCPLDQNPYDIENIQKNRIVLSILNLLPPQKWLFLRCCLHHHYSIIFLSLGSCFEGLIWSRFSWTLINMQSFSFYHGVCNVWYPAYFDLKGFLSTKEAKDADSFTNGLLTGRTCHFLSRLFETRNMKVMIARSY